MARAPGLGAGQIATLLIAVCAIITWATGIFGLNFHVIPALDLSTKPDENLSPFQGALPGYETQMSLSFIAVIKVEIRLRR